MYSFSSRCPNLLKVRLMIYSCFTVCIPSPLPSNSTQDEEPNAQVEDVLRLHHLEELLRMFRAHKPPPPPTGRQGKSLHSPGKLDIKEFKTTMAEVLGTHKYDGQLENLFNKACLFFLSWSSLVLLSKYKIQNI